MSRPLVIRGGRLLDADRPGAEAGDLLVEDGRIAAVLPAGAPVPDDAEVLDASDRLIIPGLGNAHAHSHLTFAKGVQDRWTLELHLAHGPWTNALMTPEHRYLAAQLSAAEMLAKGCTSVCDLHNEIPIPTREGMIAVAQGYRDAGMRALVSPMLADRNLWQAIPGLAEALPADLVRPFAEARFEPPDAVLDRLQAIRADWPFDPLQAPFGAAPTIPLHCSDELIRAAVRFSEETGAELHMHVAESKVQAVAGLERYGCSLTAHLDRVGLLGPRFTLAHAVWTDEADLDLVAARGAKIAHNPGSNLRLGSGIARAQDMVDRGITVGIGTDGASCADGLNMFESLRLAPLVSHVTSTDPERWLTARDAFRMATEGSAAVVGLAGETGRIAPGQLADLVLLDLGHINYVPLNDPLHQVVFIENGAAVDRVLVGGEIVVEGGRPTRIDLPALRARVEAAVDEIRATVSERRVLAEVLAPHTGAFCQCLAGSRFPFSRYAAEAV
jgi:cytosine/adenosine deaminase-related metal-dependent hydrolase